MLNENKIKKENIRRLHYVILGFATFKEVLAKFEHYMKFYRFENLGVAKEKEIIYDVNGNILSNGGIVISKSYHDKKVEFNVTKISMLPGEMKEDSEPKDFSLEISAAIEDLFGVNFTFDLDSIVKQSFPKIEVDVDKNEYKIIGGTGFRAKLSYETAIYKDIATKNKVDRDMVVLELEEDPYYQEENEKVLQLIDKKIKELGLFDLSRFEIAEKLLYPKIEDEGQEGGEEE